MRINSHTGFQPLQEVWLGDTYPEEFFDTFLPEEQELMCYISEKTKNDLNKIEKKLHDLGVTVRRPDFLNKENFLDEEGNLCKPPITPRDWGLTIADTLYIIPQYEHGWTGFESTINDYINNGENVKVLDRSVPDPMCFVQPPSVVRVGKDIFMDHDKDNSESYNFFLEVANELSKNYRIHITHTGDHSDGVFCPVKPRCIFSTHYKTEYDSTFPDWEINFLPDTTKKRQINGHNGNWWVPGKNYQHFNNNVLKKAKDWIGDSSETVFEVNMLVIDEKNILCISEDEWALRKLEEYGITPHVCDFSTRGFWDGGLHCLTLDICREGKCEDYWTGRGRNGLYFY